MSRTSARPAPSVASGTDGLAQRRADEVLALGPALAQRRADEVLALGPALAQLGAGLAVGVGWRVAADFRRSERAATRQWTALGSGPSHIPGSPHPAPVRWRKLVGLGPPTQPTCAS